MKMKYLVSIVFLLLFGAGAWYASSHQKTSLLEERLAACGSFPSGSTHNVAETTRVFINLPKDIYPDLNLQVISHGATAGYISNGGPYGSAFGAQGKPDCWSYYFEFDLTPDNTSAAGEVDLASKSGTSDIADYLIHFVVAAATGTPAASTQQGAGTLQGTMTIGPICPVERIGHPCEPTPQMYAAHQVFVYNKDGAKLIATLTPDAQGHFSATLPAGIYLVDVAHQSVGAVHGAPSPVTIAAGQTATLAIAIDTGIR